MSLVAFSSATGQPAPAAPAQPSGRGAQAPTVVSPSVDADRRVTFRVLAAQAQTVRLASPDVPNASQLPAFSRESEGVWSLTVGPLAPGPYRYTFNVDGMTVVDSRNPTTSEANATVFSLLYVTGHAESDVTRVPHGVVAPVHYYSTALGRHRRMHVYTPPGYHTSRDRYPVLYLLHGSSDSDHSWPSIGRAGLILDNLIATKRARPMIVVMPAGHTTGPTQTGSTTQGGGASSSDDFVRDFVTDVMPFVEQQYRVLTNRDNRAIAGLSMGGSQTLNIAIPHLERFAYVGVFSAGLLGSGGRGRGAGAATPQTPFGAEWEQQHQAKLGDAGLKRGLKVFWFGTGSNDFLLENTHNSVALFKRHGFNVEFEETPDVGHTWNVWRDYLVRFTPRLFR